MEIITVVNQKGGCGKTITAVNLAGAISGLGKKVLLVDLDPQAHATSALGIDITETIKSSLLFFDAFLNSESDANFKGMPQQRYNRLWIIGSHILLSTVEQRLAGMKDAVLVLASALKREDFADFDYIIVDTPPNLGFLTLNAIHAANRIIAPVDISLFSLNGISQINEVLDLSASMGFARPATNFLITIFDKRSNFAKSFVKKAKERLCDQLLHTVIRSNVKLREAAATGRVVFEHDRNSNGAKDYLALAKEFIPALKQEQFDIREFTPTKQFLQALFKLHAPEAKNVYLAGSFNNWAIDTTSIMKRLDDGTWLKALPLPSGTYHYKFVVDGRWIEDPANSSTESDGLGGKNSLITINTQTL